MDELNAFLDDLLMSLPSMVERVSLETMHELDLAMKDRIFKRGLATGGELLKDGNKYSKSWAKVRKDKGRQINKIDLQFTGATLRGIGVRKTSLGTVISFNSDKNADKIDELEKIWKQEITDPRDNEAQATLMLFEKIFNEKFDELARKHNLKI